MKCVVVKPFAMMMSPKGLPLPEWCATPVVRTAPWRACE